MRKPYEGVAVRKPRSTSRVIRWLPAGLVMALFILAEAAGSGVARAQVLKCENDWLHKYDDMALRAAALKVLPKSVHLGAIRACRNPDWAYGFIETRKKLAPEGVEQWYKFTCRREAQIWKCDVPEFKQLFATSVVVSGVAHPIELSFDKESSLERARALASRAIEAYLDPTSLLPACGVSDLNESDRLRAHSSLSPLPNLNAIHITVSSPAKDSVTLDDVNVSIDFRPNGTAAEYEAVCWGQLIVVT